jgi:hypothetical protein
VITYRAVVDGAGKVAAVFGVTDMRLPGAARRPAGACLR